MKDHRTCGLVQNLSKLSCGVRTKSTTNKKLYMYMLRHILLHLIAAGILRIVEDHSNSKT